MRPACVPEVALDHRVPARHRRVLNVTAMISAAISAFFAIQGLFVGEDLWWIAALNLASAAVFLMIPKLYRFGDLVAPLVFFLVAYASITVVCWHLDDWLGLGHLRVRWPGDPIGQLEAWADRRWPILRPWLPSRLGPRA